MKRKDAGLLLHKNFAFKADSVADDGTFTGYGSVFGNVDSYGEIVEPGAFSKSLKAIRDSGDPLPMLWNHKSDEPIGGYTSLEEDARGLKVSGFIMIGEVARAREVHALMKRRVVKGLSIGYYTTNSSYNEKTGIRSLIELDLREVSPVTFPANVEAEVESVKSAIAGILQRGQLPGIKQFEELLREVGFSKSQAAAVANGGLSKLSRGEPGGEKGDEILAALRSFNLTPN
jgi:HK97 family phage prohead protease